MVYDGWHTINEFCVWTENNVVMYCYYRDYNDNMIQAKPYHYTGKQWVDVTGKCTLSALRSGLRRDTYAIF